MLTDQEQRERGAPAWGVVGVAAAIAHFRGVSMCALAQPICPKDVLRYKDFHLIL